ncbi:MAG: hypothetical protein ACE5K4_05840 [Candidatus Hydrothermarchaeota archaeon]
MRRVFIFILIFLLVLSFRTLYYYRGVYSPPDKGPYNVSQIEVLPTGEFPTMEEIKGKGTVLFDLSHENNFEPKDVNVLVSKIVSSGGKVEYLKDPSNFRKKLKYADSFVIISPRKRFTAEEKEILKYFVQKKGKILLIGDPDKKSDINDVSTLFGILYRDDYLYNLRENEGNFRNIFLRDFYPSNLTSNLKKIVFFSACSLDPKKYGLIFTSNDTYSSKREETGRYSPVLMRGPVLAIGDATFLKQPYNDVAQNNQFISNLVDFLIKSMRRYHLSDFPYFLKENTHIALTNKDLMKYGINLRNFLEVRGISSKITNYQTTKNDMIYLGLYDSYSEVSHYLKGVSIGEDEIKIKGVGNFGRKNTTVVYLNEDAGRFILIILSEKPEGIENTLKILEEENLEKIMVDDMIGINFG